MFSPDKQSDKIENLGSEINAAKSANIFSPDQEEQLLTLIKDSSFDDLQKIIDGFKKSNHNQKIIEAIIDKFTDNVWQENLDSDFKFNLYHDFFYDHFQDYEDELIKKLDLKCENSFQNIRYLDFIEDLHKYSEDYWYDAPKEMAKIIKHLEQMADSENSGYFLSLRAKEILERIKEPAYDSYEDMQARWDEKEQRAKEKYGEKWEKFAERDYNNELENLPEQKCIGDSVDEQLPFIIAPKVYAISHPEYFSISKKENFAEISELTKRYEEALNATMVLSDGYGAYTLDDEAVGRADSIKAELDSYFRKRLAVEDMTVSHQKNEKGDKIKKQNFHNYRFMASSWFRNKIKEELGVDLSQLDFKYQFYFLYLANWQTNREFTDYKKFLDSGDNKIDRIKTLLTLEIDLQNSGKITEISKKLEQKKADKVFSKIAALTDKIEASLDELTVNNKNIDIKKIRLELLKRAHRIIQNFSGENKDAAKLFQDLENSKAEITLLSSLLKVAKESGIKLTPKNIRGMKMETHKEGELAGDRGEEFRSKYEEAVMKMMRQSYAKVFEENPGAQAKVEANFKKRFENLDKYRVYLLMFQGEAVAFSVINPSSEKCGPDEVMSESTVVHPETQGKGAIGIEFLKKIFAREFEDPKVTAIIGQVRLGHPAGKCYDAIGLKVDPRRPKFTEEGVEYEWRVARKDGGESRGTGDKGKI